jgi:hypothetical protein
VDRGARGRYRWSDRAHEVCDRFDPMRDPVRNGFS